MPAKTAILFLIFSVYASPVFPGDSLLKFNQVQFLGSHNSYRLQTYEPLYNLIRSGKKPFLKWFLSKPWEYSHSASIDSQLTVYGLRSLELDIYYDPYGGAFSERKGNKLIGESVASGIEALDKPGLKVMHIPDFDYMTHHYTFIDALQAIKNWSDARPRHFPLVVMVETKEYHVMKFLKRKKFRSEVVKFTSAALDSVDAEVKKVFGNELKGIFTPDSLRGNYQTLEDAVLKNGWPELEKMRGKIVFVLFSLGKTSKGYLKNHPSLKRRAMFLFSEPGKPEAAFIKHDDPVKHFSEIQKLVKQGYIVRTRSDANTKEARKGDYERMKKAFESGAQIISTDYYRKSKWTDYKVFMPGNHVAIVNQLTGFFRNDSITVVEE